ncbi:hypothetical protein KAT51_00245 [bacterium]|nr:hypothetical protein [bacterium]
MKEKDEKELVRDLKSLIEERRTSSLKKIFIHTNLATKKFRDIWSEWWGSEIPPRLEVDMIPVFEDINEIDKVLISGVEVKFFKSETRSFYEGLQQVLAFGLFGFDSLVLWHIFSEEMENKSIEGYVKPVKEIIDGFELPIVYYATKLTEEFKFEFFAPWEFYSSQRVEVENLLSSLRDQCNEKRNPLLNMEEIERRRKLLKVILKIPV